MSTIIVKGIPASVNSSPGTRTAWKSMVAAEGIKKCTEPSNAPDLRITIKYFYDGTTDIDSDNISKPICDALIGVAYNDDSQLMDRNVGKRNINGSYRIKGVDPEIAVAIAEGEPFISITIENIGTGVTEI